MISEAAAPAVDLANWKRNVALFLSSQTVPLFGSMLVQYAVMWHVTFETRSGLVLALYTVAAFLPQGIVSIFGGVLADRMNRRILVMVANGALVAATLVLVLVMVSGVTDLWVIFVAVALRSLADGVLTPAVPAMTPQLVPGDQLMRVNGLSDTIQSTMAIIAPALAGVIFGIFGLTPVFVVYLVTVVIGIVLLAFVTVPTLARVADTATSYRVDLVDGLRYIWGHGVVRWLLVVFAIISLLTVAPGAITSLMVARTFGTEVWMVSVLEIVFSVGMVLGGVLVSTLLAKRSRVRLLLFSTFGFGVLSIAVGLSPDIWVFYGFIFGFGLLVPLFSTPFMTLVQETVAPAQHGRVFSYVGIVMAFATPFGASVFGPLADVVSVQLLLVLAGLAAILVMVMAILMPSGRAAMAGALELRVTVVGADVVDE